jgi:hypothetical protein
MKIIAIAIVTAAAGCMVGDDAGYDDGTGELAEAPQTIPGCNGVSTVLLYSEATYELTLPNGFAAAQDACTRYYVHLPALSADKTMPRGGADKVHALGPNFHAMAEFSWGAWHDWIAASPGTRDWETAGKVFRQRMTDAGYDVAGGDTWAINEFPSTTRSGVDDVWTHERNAVKGLYEGQGTTSQGVVYLAGMGQTLQNFSVYKPLVEGWLQQDAYWADMDRYVRWYSYEVYADPHTDCGDNVVDDRNNLNAYLEHVPRLAANGGSRTQVAHDYLDHAYVPLLNAAFNSNNGFGDNVIPLTAFEKFMRLQVYSTHVWAANHAYPGRRIGFAWAPKGTTATQESDLTAVIANSVARSYPAGGFYGLGKFACTDTGQLEGCGCQVNGSFNTQWNTFETW